MKSVYTQKVLHLLRLTTSAIRAWSKPKIFCIGLNKTGTTSLAMALQELGFTVGEQHLAELLLYDWSRRDFRRLFFYCHSAQAFQDVPFSLPFTFQALDQHFPHNKFILTVRDSAEQWYSSRMNFNSAVFSNGRPTTLEDLKASSYVRPGWAYDANRLIHNTPLDDPFNKQMFIAHYNTHNSTVREYFRHRPQDLLVLNIAEPGAYRELCAFLGKPCIDKEFPWENKTSNFTKTET